jgi:hypothetical protein
MNKKINFNYMAGARKIAIIPILLVVILSGCRHKKSIVGTWHSVRLENKDIDSFYIKTQQYIDTIGKTNDPAINMGLYGTTNIDSLRKEIQVRFDSTKALQMRSVTNTVITFKPDGMVYLSFNGNMDTSKWTMGADNMLRLTDMNAETQHDTITWEVAELTDTSLVVKMKKDSSFSKVTFHPEGK